MGSINKLNETPLAQIKVNKMKRYTIGLITLLLIVGCSKPIDEESLVTRGGLKYQQDSQKPYSGKILDLYDNGNKEKEGSYKDGIPDGLWTWWDENGLKEKEWNYKKDGMVHETLYHRNSLQKLQETNYKDGVPDGLVTAWHENGQKDEEGTYKDGVQGGLLTRWYENGQKKYERIYKDGKSISVECWDEGGNECECNSWSAGCK